MKNKLLSTIFEVVDGCLDKEEKTEDDLNRFHFVVTKEMKERLDQIRELTGWTYEMMVSETSQLLFMLLHYLSKTKKRLLCIPKGDDPLSERMSVHVNITMPFNVYREFKNAHTVCNSFSMAMIMRMYIVC